MNYFTKQTLKRMAADTVWAFGAIAVLVILALTFQGCQPKTEGKPSTGVVYTQFDTWDQLGGPTQLLVSRYGQVDRNWIIKAYPEWRAELHRDGVVRWDPRFNCVHFSTHFVAWAQLRHYLESFHSGAQTAQSLALGVFAYRSNTRGGHALVEIVTQNGREFFEPQTGEFVVLTPEEIKSSWTRSL